MRNSSKQMPLQKYVIYIWRSLRETLTAIFLIKGDHDLKLRKFMMPKPIAIQILRFCIKWLNISIHKLLLMKSGTAI
jgi:hypothetical protein